MNTARPARTAGPVARIAADSRPVLIVTVITTAAVALASFALSFASLRDAALWGRVPEGIAFLVPVVIDASVLVYGLVALVLRSRGRSSAWAWTLMLLFTVVSIGANAAHAYDVGPQLRTIVGVVLVALAPLSVLTSTHALASLVVTDDPTPAVQPENVEAESAEALPSPAPLSALEPAPADDESAVDEPATPVPASAPVPVLGPVRSSRTSRLRGPVEQSMLPGLDMPGVTA